MGESDDRAVDGWLEEVRETCWGGRSGWMEGCDERWLALELQRIHQHEQLMLHEESR